MSFVEKYLPLLAVSVSQVSGSHQLVFFFVWFSTGGTAGFDPLTHFKSAELKTNRGDIHVCIWLQTET